MHQLYVRGSSFHPPHTTFGVVVGEALHALRACSEEKQSQVEQHRLVTCFRQLGFSRKPLREVRAIRFVDCTAALAQTTPKTTALVFFVTDFVRFRPSLNFALRKHWLAMESNLGLSSHFRAPPLLSNKGSSEPPAPTDQSTHLRPLLPVHIAVFYSSSPTVHLPSAAEC